MDMCYIHWFTQAKVITPCQESSEDDVARSIAHEQHECQDEQTIAGKYQDFTKDFKQVTFPQSITGRSDGEKQMAASPEETMFNSQSEDFQVAPFISCYAT